MRSPLYTTTPWQGQYSEIIDVRSEKEFIEDHIPSAINLPVLNNAERAKVGTIYKQVSPFEARKIGAALVSKNISHYLTEHFATKEKNYSPLVYCWRGGQRSHSLALVLSQIGWRVTVVDGGYQTYRAYVREELSELPQQFKYQILCGLTGSGKTHILRELATRGVQVLDLEKLANHRGSLLGEEWEGKTEPQPTQKKFESLLLQELQKFEPHKTIWLESESNKIGQIYLPSSLWEMMKQANCVEVQLPLEARVEWLLQEYPHLVNYPEVLKSKLALFKFRYGKKKIEQWYELIDEKQWQILVGDLLVSHYDPSYHHSMGKTFQGIKKELKIPDLSIKSVHGALEILRNFQA